MSSVPWAFKVGVLAGALLGTAVISPSGAQAWASANRSSGASSLAGEVVPASDVLSAVEAAQALRSVPRDLQPGLTVNDEANPVVNDMSCRSAPNRAGVPFYAFGGCTYGDLSSSKLMVVYGDSHAAMWAEALQYIALRAGWKLVTYYLWNCPAPDLSYISSQTGSPNKQCSEFHEIAPPAVARLHPQLVVVTSEAGYQQVARGVVATPAQWQSGWAKAIQELRRPGTRTVMIGDIPQWGNDDAYCLGAHMDDVQSCATSPKEGVPVNVPAEERAAGASKVQYISPEPWICARKCEPIIGGMRVYNDEYHLTGDYVEYLSGALQQALGLPDAKP